MNDFKHFRGRGRGQYQHNNYRGQNFNNVRRANPNSFGPLLPMPHFRDNKHRWQRPPQHQQWRGRHSHPPPYLRGPPPGYPPSPLGGMPPRPQGPQGPQSPLPGSEEARQKAIAEASARIKQQLNLESENEQIPGANFTSFSDDLANNFAEDYVAPEAPKQEKSVKKRAKKCSESVVAHTSVEELRNKILNQFTMMSKGKITSLVNNPGSSKYDNYLQHLVRDMRLHLSSELRNMYNKRENDSNHSIIDHFNSIVPDLGVELVNLPDTMVAELSKILQFDVQNTPQNIASDEIVQPEDMFKEAEQLLLNTDFLESNFQMDPVPNFPDMTGVNISPDSTANFVQNTIQNEESDPFFNRSPLCNEPPPNFNYDPPNSRQDIFNPEYINKHKSFAFPVQEQNLNMRGDVLETADMDIDDLIDENLAEQQNVQQNVEAAIHSNLDEIPLPDASSNASNPLLETLKSPVLSRDTSPFSKKLLEANLPDSTNIDSNFERHRSSSIPLFQTHSLSNSPPMGGAGFRAVSLPSNTSNHAADAFGASFRAISLPSSSSNHATDATHSISEFRAVSLPSNSSNHATEQSTHSNSPFSLRSETSGTKTVQKTGPKDGLAEKFHFDSIFTFKPKIDNITNVTSFLDDVVSQNILCDSTKHDTKPHEHHENKKLESDRNINEKGKNPFENSKKKPFSKPNVAAKNLPKPKMKQISPKSPKHSRLSLDERIKMMIRMQQTGNSPKKSLEDDKQQNYVPDQQPTLSKSQRKRMRKKQRQEDNKIKVKVQVDKNTKSHPHKYLNKYQEMISNMPPDPKPDSNKSDQHQQIQPANLIIKQEKIDQDEDELTGGYHNQSTSQHKVIFTPQNKDVFTPKKKEIIKVEPIIEQIVQNTEIKTKSPPTKAALKDLPPLNLQVSNTFIEDLNTNTPDTEIQSSQKDQTCNDLLNITKKVEYRDIPGVKIIKRKEGTELVAVEKEIQENNDAELNNSLNNQESLIENQQNPDTVQNKIKLITAIDNLADISKISEENFEINPVKQNEEIYPEPIETEENIERKDEKKSEENQDKNPIEYTQESENIVCEQPLCLDNKIEEKKTHDLKEPEKKKTQDSKELEEKITQDSTKAEKEKTQPEEEKTQVSKELEEKITQNLREPEKKTQDSKEAEEKKTQDIKELEKEKTQVSKEAEENKIQDMKELETEKIQVSKEAEEKKIQDIKELEMEKTQDLKPENEKTQDSTEPENDKTEDSNESITSKELETAKINETNKVSDKLIPLEDVQLKLNPDLHLHSVPEHCKEKEPAKKPRPEEKKHDKSHEKERKTESHERKSERSESRNDRDRQRHKSKEKDRHKSQNTEKHEVKKPEDAHRREKSLQRDVEPNKNTSKPTETKNVQYGSVQDPSVVENTPSTSSIQQPVTIVTSTESTELSNPSHVYKRLIEIDLQIQKLMSEKFNLYQQLNLSSFNFNTLNFYSPVLPNQIFDDEEDKKTEKNNKKPEHTEVDTHHHHHQHSSYHKTSHKVRKRSVTPVEESKKLRKRKISESLTVKTNEKINENYPELESDAPLRKRGRQDKKSDPKKVKKCTNKESTTIENADTTKKVRETIEKVVQHEKEQKKTEEKSEKVKEQNSEIVETKPEQPIQPIESEKLEKSSKKRRKKPNTSVISEELIEEPNKKFFVRIKKPEKRNSEPDLKTEIPVAEKHDELPEKPEKPKPKRSKKNKHENLEETGENTNNNRETATMKEPGSLPNNNRETATMEELEEKQESNNNENKSEYKIKIKHETNEKIKLKIVKSELLKEEKTSRKSRRLTEEEPPPPPSRTKTSRRKKAQDEDRTSEDRSRSRSASKDPEPEEETPIIPPNLLVIKLKTNKKKKGKEDEDRISNDRSRSRSASKDLEPEEETPIISPSLPATKLKHNKKKKGKEDEDRTSEDRSRSASKDPEPEPQPATKLKPNKKKKGKEDEKKTIEETRRSRSRSKESDTKKKKKEEQNDFSDSDDEVLILINKKKRKVPDIEENLLISEEKKSVTKRKRKEESDTLKTEPLKAEPFPEEQVETFKQVPEKLVKNCFVKLERIEINKNVEKSTINDEEISDSEFHEIIDNIFDKYDGTNNDSSLSVENTEQSEEKEDKAAEINDEKVDEEKDEDKDEEKDEDTLEIDKLEEGVFCTGHHKSILDIKILGNDFLAASEDGTVYKYSLITGELHDAFTGHMRAVTCISVVHGSRVLDPTSTATLMYSGSLDCTLKCFNIETAEVLDSVQVEQAIQCMDVAWGNIFLGTYEGLLFIYNIKKKLLNDTSLTIANATVLMIKATTEGSRQVLILASRKREIMVRDAFTGLLLRTMCEDQKPTIYSLLLDKSRVYCGTSDKGILILDFHNGTQTNVFNSGKGVVCMIMYKSLLFAGCYDGLIYVYNTKNNKHITTISGPGEGMLLSLAITDGLIIAGTKKDHLLKIWRIPQDIINQID